MLLKEIDSKTFEKMKEETLVIYTDGSNKLNNCYSLGMVAFMGDLEIYRFAKHFDDKYNDMRNVAGEVLGGMFAAQFAIRHGFNKVIIVHDYVGVSKWACQLWKRNNELTQKYQRYMLACSKEIDIYFFNVKGHIGIEGNEIADQLAKSALEIPILQEYKVIDFTENNILECKEDWFIQQVNCKGAMGKGLALETVKKYPEVKEAYLKTCESVDSYNDLLGHVEYVKTHDRKTAVLMFSQENYGYAQCFTNYKAFSECINKVMNHAMKTGASVAIPFMIACGYGGGNWDLIFSDITKAVMKTQVDTTIYKITPAEAI